MRVWTAVVIVLAAMMSGQVNLLAQSSVILTPTSSPGSGQAGVTSINITGSGFPSGTILPASTTVTLTLSGGAAATTKATAITTIAGTTRRVTFVVPTRINVTAPSAYQVSVAGTTTANLAFASTNTAALTVIPAARLTTLSPTSGQQGQNLTVSVTGQYTTFVQGSTQASFGAGISVGNAAEGSPGPLTITSSTTATAQLHIGASAAPGERDVVVQTGLQQAALSAGFTVAQTASITRVDPAEGAQGSSFGIAIAGQGSHFTQGVTLISLGPGTTVTNIAVVTPTLVTAQVSLSATASTGPRSVAVVTSAEVVSLNNAFTVKPPLPAISSSSPSSTQRGQNVTLTVTGAFTNFVQGQTRIDAGGGVKVISVTVGSKTALTAQVSIDSAAVVGTRNLSVYTGSEIASLSDAFRVQSGPSIAAFADRPPNSEGWYNANVLVSFVCTDSVAGIASCPSPVTVSTEGAQHVSGTAMNNSGISVSAALDLKLDKTPPLLAAMNPADGAILSSPTITATGAITDALSGIAGITCNNASAQASLSCPVTLASGLNAIVISATDKAGNKRTSTISVTYRRTPEVTLNLPGNLAYLNVSPTTVSGTVDDATATVTVNAVNAPVVNGVFTAPLPLAEGPNIITATARTALGAVGTASIEVTLDTTPPRVTVTAPPDGFITAQSSISVAGIVNDIVVGTVNNEQAHVTVNGLSAQVANRTFLATEVPLALGVNLLQVVGRDRVGNFIATQVSVTRQSLTEPQIRMISGNNQTGSIRSVLSQPLVVSLTDATGNPVSGKPVVFKVTQNDGVLAATGQPAPTVIAATDAQGQAHVEWTLGARAGAGGNAVEAYSVGFAGTAIFAATGIAGSPAKIVVDTGNDQSGAISQPLPKPLIAVVVDDGNNRLAGVPVTFAVKSGGGNFDGQSSFSTTSDSDGRVAGRLTLGPEEGSGNNLAEARFTPSGPNAALFTASGLQPGNPEATVISGVVLDNSNLPIAGVTVRAVLADVLHANLGIVPSLPVAQSNAEGQFAIPQAPVGAVKLMVDGSTALPLRQYPSLEYDLVTIAGQTNTVGLPIYLPVLNAANQLCVTATTGGGTLTIPEAPGFSLTFAPGQVTFPGGSKTGCVSVSVVHGDKVPMVPGFGQQPNFIVTIQPPGAVFSPPAPITLPNVDGLAPRAVTEMYSYDHDISSFIAIGTGTVSEDGSTIRSNPGVGVLKAGWHCGGNPTGTGRAAPLTLRASALALGMKAGQTVSISAFGDPPLDASYRWEILSLTPSQDAGAVQLLSNPACANQQTCPVQIKGIRAGHATLRIHFICSTTGLEAPPVDVPVGVVTNATIEIGGSPDQQDDITSLGQTIKARISVTGSDAQVELAVLPAGRATIDRSVLNLADGVPQEVVITPRVQSTTPNDVQVVVSIQGTELAREDMTIVRVVLPKKIRALNTPPSMPDRIPPGKPYDLDVTVEPNLSGSGQFIFLNVSSGALSGDFTLDGKVQLRVENSRTVSLIGTSQTEPGHAGGLYVVAGTYSGTAASTDGFSVAAIPVTLVESLVGPATGFLTAGIEVSITPESDSGDPRDLDRVNLLEQVAFTGVLFCRPLVVTQAGYLPIIGGRIDVHKVPTVCMSSGDTITVDQIHLFSDTRTGVTDIPIAESGFVITHAQTGSLITTTKLPKANSVNGYTVDAGKVTGSLTVTQ